MSQAAMATRLQWIPSQRFLMGSDRFYAEERPLREADVDGFWIETTPVTNRQFAAFVANTGHVTGAERTPRAEDYPGAASDSLVAGSAVFVPTTGPVPLDDERRWWRYVEGACWRQPEGPGSTVEGREDHPAVHVALVDAEAYAAWTGRSLPTEAEWEVAARGGLDGADFAWGDDPSPAGRANTWQGDFPWRSAGRPAGTSAVGSFPPNGLELYDATGNVWEWTASRHEKRASAGSCCTPPQLARQTPRHVIKGGSFLCSAEYCLRYRPAARQALDVDSSTSHLGFRCVVRPAD
ncbi:MAG: formylglycine-generating enzyme family protein [Gaiellaceae bacterium]